MPGTFVAGTVSADPLGVLVSFGAGIISFLSPCVLPLVPGYVSLVSGLSAAELEVVPAAAGSETTKRRRPMGPLLRGIALFVLGFTVVFVALGAVASGLGQVLHSHLQALTTTAGAVVVALGAVLVVASLPAGVWAHLGSGVSGRVGWLVGDRRIHVRPATLGAWAAPVVGMAFAFAWTPCIGPVLAAVLGMAATRSTLAGGVLLLIAYSLGLAVPFVAAGVAFDRLTGLLGRVRHRLTLVQALAGLVLVAFGAILLAGDLGWLSAQFSALLDHLGLHRLTVS